jgi:hypothetical protein
MARFIKVMNKHKRGKNKGSQKKAPGGSPSGIQRPKARHNKSCKINNWNEAHMQHAIEEYHSSNGRISVRQLARSWNVPRSTLKLRIDGKVDGYRHASGRKPVFDDATETDLVNVIKLLAQRGFPFGMTEVRLIAYTYARQHGIAGFSTKKQAAGYEWFHSFLRRHPDLSIRTPEPLSIARATGMNRPIVDKWFTSLEARVDELGIRNMPTHFWNVDESGLQDYFVPTQVVGEVGKPCYQSTSTERGETTTIVAAFNAVGTFVKTLVILHGKRLKPEWLDNMPADLDVMLRMSANGWITSELFVAWGENFCAQLPKNDSLPHILFLDGHGSHVYNLDFLNLMKRHNVDVWCFPAHTTHWLQPADRSFFRSLKHNWNEEGLKSKRIAAGAKMTKEQFFQLLATAWKKSATVENAQSGFCATGLFPLNRNKIPEEAFMPSMTTDRPFIPGNIEPSNNIPTGDQSSNKIVISLKA